MSETQVTSEQFPKHIAIIMDGNGRWAKSKGKPRVFGHRAGAKAVRKTISSAAKLGIKAITLFAFSSENWKRPVEEVNLLMDLFINALSKEAKSLHKNNLQLRVIGDKRGFSERLQKKIAEVETLTAANTGMVVNVAANYGGKWDITEATKNIARKVKQNEIDLDDISEGLIGDNLTMSDLPEVDLLIRTSGECRISNFMLWQLAYAEIYFMPEYWPDFDENSLSEAVSWFINRERRFGCTGEQIKALITN
ncbi:isoprenyl transferase [Vibrio sp. HN007]|uniref:isoprenyl transferase n=1 Tax=Vibrio iocasae TaxID=3098914 RepID=UPI0035D4E598